MGRIDDIQTALKPLKKSEKIEIHFYDDFKTKTVRPDPTRPDPTVMLFDDLFLEKFER